MPVLSMSAKQFLGQRHRSFLQALAWIVCCWFALTAAYAHAGQYAYVISSFYPSPNTLFVIDTTTNTVVNSVFVDSPNGIALNPAGTRLYVSSASITGYNITVIDTTTLLPVAAIPLSDSPSKIVVNAAGTR